MSLLGRGEKPNTRYKNIKRKQQQQQQQNKVNEIHAWLVTAIRQIQQL